MQTSSKPEQFLKSNKPQLEFNQVLQDLPLPVFLCNEQGVIIFSNQVCDQIFPDFPKTGTSIFQKEVFSFMDKDGKRIPTEELEFLKSVELKKPVITQRYYTDKLRNTGYSITSKLHTIQDNGDLAFQFNFLPFSESLEKSIKKSMLSDILESSNDAVISTDLSGAITSWNKGAQKIFKYSEKEILGKTISILIPESLWEEEQTILKTIKSGKTPDNFDTYRINKDGEVIHLSMKVSPVKNEFGKVIGASQVARDISDRIINQKKQARLSAIVESSDDGIISKDRNGIINSWNLGASRIFGYSESEVIGKSITILIPENRLDEEKLILSKIQSGERIEHFETIRLSKNKKEIPVSVSVSPLKDSQGNIVGASKIVRNIEEQIKSKLKIESYVEKLRILNSVGKDISSKLDLETVLQKVTDATTKLSGAKFGAFFYNTHNESGESMMLYTLSGAPKKAFEKLGMPRHTAVFQPTFSGHGIVRVDDITEDPRYGLNPPHNGMPVGHLNVRSYMAIPVISNSGRIIGGLIFGHPEKEIFKKEHEIMVRNIAAQAAITLDNSQLFEKVKTLSEKKDEFIALASHELKTPLTTIKGYLQILEKKVKEPKSKQFLTKTLDQANRLNTLIDDLLNMSRIEAGKLEFNYEEFDLREILEDISETYNYSENSHELITSFGDEPVFVKADKQRIEQVLNNLLSNAVKYSPTGDKVYIRLDKGKDEVTIFVKDKGLGLSAEQQKNVFNRFYRAESTKGINGLGLGLYLTKQIIDEHNGKLGVTSETGKGSEFYFSLPF